MKTRFHGIGKYLVRFKQFKLYILKIEQVGIPKCTGCFYDSKSRRTCKHIACSARERKDGKNIIIKTVW